MIPKALRVVSQLVCGEGGHAIRRIRELSLGLVPRLIIEARLTTDIAQIVVHIERELKPIDRLKIHEGARHNSIPFGLAIIQISQLDSIEILTEWTFFIVVIDQISITILEILTSKWVMLMNRINRGYMLCKAGPIGILISEGARRLGVSMNQATRCPKRKPWTDVVREVRTKRISLVTRLNHISRFIQIPKGEIGFHVLRAETTTKRIVTAVSRTIECLIPV